MVRLALNQRKAFPASLGTNESIVDFEKHWSNFDAAPLCRYLSSQTVWGVYGSLRVRTAQTILAVLLAMATVATRAGLRSSNEVSYLLARSGCDLVCRTSDVMPTTSNDRKY